MRIALGRRELSIAWAALLSAVLLSAVLCHATTAHADDGEGFGFGPVLAFSATNATSLGWELGAMLGAGSIFSRLSLGGSYRLSAYPRDPAYFHYLAWEPWLYVGGTLGAALTDQFAPRVTYGLWEALPQSLDGELFADSALQWVLSIAIGWRGVGGTQQFYITPKLWRMHGYDFD